MSIENLLYKTIPGGYAAREASKHQETSERKDAFVAGFLQGVQYGKPDPNVISCPRCQSVLVHMHSHAPINVDEKLIRAGRQYDDRVEANFHCRSCQNVFPVVLQFSVA